MSAELKRRLRAHYEACAAIMEAWRERDYSYPPPARPEFPKEFRGLNGGGRGRPPRRGPGIWPGREYGGGLEPSGEPLRRCGPACPSRSRKPRLPVNRHRSPEPRSRPLEDVLVLDAAAFEVRKTRGGTITALDIIDGSTIKVLIDDTGRMPQPPAPAYEQVIHGRPWVLAEDGRHREWAGTSDAARAVQRHCRNCVA